MGMSLYDRNRTGDYWQVGPASPINSIMDRSRVNRGSLLQEPI